MTDASTPLIERMQLILGPARRGGSENVLFQCPFHSGGRHRGWSFTMHIDTGLCNCKSCGRGWSLYQLLEAVGLKHVYKEFKSSGIIIDMPRVPRVARTRTAIGLPEEVLYVFSNAHGRLPFPNEVLDDFGVRFDDSRNRIVYPIRDHKGRLRALHYRDPNAIHPWQTRYRFYSKEDFAELNVDYSDTGKEECLWNGERVLPRLWSGELSWYILTEGEKQTMRVSQAGFENVMGVLGSMGNEQLRILTRFDACAVLFMDNNPPGQKAAKSYKGKLRYRSVPTVAVRYPDEEEIQPDEMELDDIRRVITSALEEVHESDQRWTDGPVPTEQEGG